MKDIKITDLVDPLAFKQLKDLDSEYKKLLTTYSELAVKMAGGVKVNPSTISGLKAKSEEYNAVMKQLADTQNQLSDVQAKYKDSLKGLSEQIRIAVKDTLDLSKAEKLVEQSLLATAKADTDRIKQQRMLNQEQKKINQEQKKQKVTTEELNEILKKQAVSIQEAEAQNKRLRIAVKQVTDEEDKEGKVRQSLNLQIDKNTGYIRRNSDALKQQKMNIGDYKNQVKAAMLEIENGNRSLKNFGVVARGTGNILKSSLSSGLGEVRMGVGSMIKGMVGAQAIVGGIQKLFGFIKEGIGSIISFEAANSRLAAVLGTTSKNIKDLTADSQRLGATTKYTASQAADLQIELAKLGFSKKEILQSTEGILKFAQATGAELPEAAALAGASLRMFGADTRETERYVSAMAVATAKSALSFSYLQTAMPIVGPVAKAFNFEIEDTLALLGKLSDAGFDASMAATATRNILLNLADGSGKLAKALGGPVKTLPDLVAGLNRLKDQGVDLNSTLELTDKRSVAAFNAFLTAANGIVPLREQITGVTGELDDMANEMGNNVQGAVLGLSSAWEAFMLSFYDSKGPMKDVIDFFSKGLREVAKQLRSYSQLQDDADNAIIAKARKEMATSDIVKNHREGMIRLYKDFINSGVSADRASLAAKEQYIQDLTKQFNIENAEYEEAIQKREQAEKNLEKYGTLGFGTNKALKEAIKNATTAAAGKKAISSITESVIEDLNKVDLRTEKLSGKFKPELTDKEKAEAEKAAKERLKIRETYQQSEFDLMDEGLEKELAKISLDFTKKMAAVKGNSDEEIKTRGNLAKMMEQAIKDKTVSFNMDREKKDISNRLDAVEKGSKDELELKMALLDLERESEIDASVKTGEDINDIDAKYKRKAIELQEKFANERNKKMQENYATESIVTNQGMQMELDELAGKYSEGLIDKEAYENGKLKITERYAILQAKAAIELAKTQLDTPGLSEDDVLSLKRKIAEAEIALAEKVRDAEIKAVEDSASKQKEKIEKLSEKIQAVGDALSAFSDLGSAIFDGKINEIDKEKDANDEAGEKEQERIERLAESGAISAEDAEARKRAAAAKTADKNKELEKQKADLQTKQAKFDKANSIVQIGISTALAIMKQLAATPLPFGAPMVALIAAMGAIQLATAIAAPIPKYAKGTDNHPGGLAIVGDGGRQEMIVANGKSWVTPSVPTLVDIPRSAQVIPDVFDVRSMRHLRSDLDMLVGESNRRGEPVMVNVNNDYRKLENELKRLNASSEKMAKYQRKAANEASYRNIYNRI